MSIEYPCIYCIDGMCKKHSDDKVTIWCVDGPCGDQMPSNADKIRAMSDEELAAWAINEAPKIGFRYTSSETGLLKWLKQLAEEDD